ncbi:hypothetical protein GCM10027275_25010 [Rhabdobacter roseus]|uniref:Uncharacterized protein n=1 Tax=Rhabdobacter roseus TaxID=1655419 RepID=A0A840TLK0_9BACT|nr:hypothetical protein [Rhabdobacter roseus]MBB5284441.1 hypothetical protein [Rhabdobacter roseus]
MILESLNRGDGQNAAAIPRIELLPCRYVTRWPGSRNGILSGTIGLATTAQWVRLYLTDQTAGFQESMKNTVQGRLHSFRVEGFYPGDSEELRRFLGLTDWERLLCRITDTQDRTRVIGSRDSGLELDYDSVIEAEMGGRRGTRMAFAGEMAIGSALYFW